MNIQNIKFGCSIEEIKNQKPIENRPSEVESKDGTLKIG